MSWVAVGVVAVGAIGSNVAANKAANTAKDAQKNQLAFEQQKLADWNRVYGPIQDNLSNYYANLTPEYIETQGLEAVELERAKALERVEVNLAQRGITDSGIASRVVKDVELNTAQQRAQVRATAPTMVAEEQSRFLQIGLGQNPGESMSRSLANQSLQRGAESAAASQAAGKATQAFFSEAGTALSDYIKEAGKARSDNKKEGQK